MTASFSKSARSRLLSAALSPAFILLASCGTAGPVESGDTPAPVVASGDAMQIGPFSVTEHGEYNEPWAAAFEPGTGRLFITEKSGALKFLDPATGVTGTVSGTPEVDYGGQGGLGDIVFSPDYADSGMVYISWAEAGDGDTRGAVVGRAKLSCNTGNACALSNMDVVWRQAPKVTGRGHYSHRIAFSPSGQHLYIASGDRQKMEPAQDRNNTLGTIVRLNLDGTPAAGNPFESQPAPTNQIWSYGHRNILGIGFDNEGRLWETEHGPKGGDELNVVKAAANYGWPVVSDGIHYDNDPIPDNSTRPELAGSAITWTPVIAPGDMTFLSGKMFDDWDGDLMLAGLKTKALIHVTTDGDTAREVARYDFGERLREVLEGPDGAIWVLEDGEGARLLRLTPGS
ncbi:MAG: PQQ-dependent sugar dehydrogenase [Pontixanthobacter sp.]